MQVLTGLGKEGITPACSPDGRLLAAGADQTFHVWDLSAGPSPVWSLTTGYISRTFTFAPDSSAVIGGRYSFARYDARTGRYTAEAFLTKFRPDYFSPGGHSALAVTSDNA